MKLPRDVTSPRTARQPIGRWFAARLESDELEAAALLTNELVTNAVRHGTGTITLQADLDEDRLLVDVIDEGGLEHAVRARDL